MNDNNKPSWLRGPLLEEEVKDSVNINSSPQSVQKNEEKLGPSWLHENSIEEGKLINEQSVKKEAKKAKSNAKWKQAPQSTGEEEEDCCCCPSDPVLFGFRCFHVASGLTGIAAFSANVYTYSSPNLQIKDAIVRTYALFFCALIVLVELDWRFVVSRVKFMDLWVFRGFFYTFVGLLTCKLNLLSRLCYIALTSLFLIF